MESQPAKSLSTLRPKPVKGKKALASKNLPQSEAPANAEPGWLVSHSLLVAGVAGDAITLAVIMMAVSLVKLRVGIGQFLVLAADDGRDNTQCTQRDQHDCGSPHPAGRFRQFRCQLPGSLHHLATGRHAGHDRR